MKYYINDIINKSTPKNMHPKIINPKN